MVGIYKITNNINGNSYIGLSVDIYKRWQNHIECYQNPNKEYDKVLYRAFRKYGINNFSFEIIEECLPNELKEKEKYWISYYNTFHNGYNATPGGDGLGLNGEKHPNHKITENDVIYIRKLWASKTLSTREMYYEFENRIGKSGFKKIYTWQTWKNILPELNTEENREWHRKNGISYANLLSKNPRTFLLDKDFENINKRYFNGEPLKSIYNDYKNYYKNYASFYASQKKRLQNKPVSTIPVVGK